MKTKSKTELSAKRLSEKSQMKTGLKKTNLSRLRKSNCFGKDSFASLIDLYLNEIVLSKENISKMKQSPKLRNAATLLLNETKSILSTMQKQSKINHKRMISAIKAYAKTCASLK